VCLYTYPPFVARQQLSKNIIEATNAHATTEELLDAFFYASHVASKESMLSVLHRTSSLKLLQYNLDFLVTP
jgi:hypothetical protein